MPSICAVQSANLYELIGVLSHIRMFIRPFNAHYRHTGTIRLYFPFSLFIGTTETTKLGSVLVVYAIVFSAMISAGPFTDAGQYSGRTRSQIYSTF